MNYQAFEYRNEFTPLLYRTQTKGFLLFKTQEPTHEPDINAFLQDPDHKERVAKLGREGWELICVQPVVRGEVKLGNQNAQGWAYGMALPMGFLMFFKRPIPSV
ncbi:hypothetical protein [Pseudomonas chlororaphis]|uniref:Aconitase B n=1 Tax=Pseudomonas chlororaphis subsp. aurantiaca TaxID=86192 RepID=A0AAJ0ZK38_9PSED|nr:hypothetical protein [Pseudomonas chlororaphis]MBU4634031.1 hypothetical protein [Pseudomonas chlororaphis subsp. aurantiaca]